MLNRRKTLWLGGLFGIGLTLPDLLARNATAAEDSHTDRLRFSFGRAKRVIMLYLHGGHPQQETFDPKPDGPSAVRGEFGAIQTSLVGIQFSDVLPHTAGIADRFAIVRSMSHTNANHVTASLPAQTGHAHPPGTPETDFPPAEADFPPIGAVLNSIRPAASGLPTWVRIGPLMRRNNGTVLHGQTPGFLGAAHSSFVVDQDLMARDVRIQAIQSAADLTSMRLAGRLDLLREFEDERRLYDHSAGARDLNAYQSRAFNLLTSDKTRRAFDLASEPAASRERYGNTEFGQRCLLARRLAESDIPMINVSYCHTPVGSWDTHGNHFPRMKDSLGPTLDVALTALVRDLEERGMLDSTLVVVNAEFGRTPIINKNGGRDHWPWVYSLALAGAGVRRGVVYGSSDNSAAYPVDNPHDPKDMAATIYHLLGVNPQLLLHDRFGRPYPLVTGRPIEGILA